MTSKPNSKRTVYVGGLADEVDEKVLNAAFVPFGDLVDVQIPLDYETEKHRGFAFIEFENAEDAAAAIDNMVGFIRVKILKSRSQIQLLLISPVMLKQHFCVYLLIKSTKSKLISEKKNSFFSFN